MKTVTHILLALILVAMPMISFAQSDNGHNRSISDVISEITASQNISSSSDTSCDDVTDDQFEELGDAVMQAMIGDDEAHKVMDNMMGGEGSESLRSMHIAMGQRYLGCAQGTFGTIGMMGGMMSMIGSNWKGGDGFMMSNIYSPWGMTGMGGIGMLLFWVIIIVGIVLLIKWLVGQQDMQTKGKSALDILKERYAKSEVSKEEFEAKKKDLA
ncbi:MAG: SHOCT domain-containing protein [bacterium]|nr:SHOCT domain-containing protein [bacterium]